MMSDVFSNPDVLAPQYDLPSIFSGSRYDMGPSPAPPHPDPQQVAAAPPPAVPAAPSPLQAAPHPVAPPRQSLQPQIADERRRAQAAFDTAQGAMGEQERIVGEKSQALKPVRDRMMELATRPLPQPPQQKEAPPAPKGNNPHDDETWLFAAGLLGAFAGALTRQHATNALAAFTGAIQGYQEGSKAKFDQNMQIWEAENKKVMETNKASQQRYRDVLQDRKLTMDQMSIALQVAGAEFDDKGMVAAAKSKNALVIANYHDQNAKAMDQVEVSYERISEQSEQKKRADEMKLAVAQMRALGVTPGQEEKYIDAIGTYREAPLTGARGTAIMRQVHEKYPDYDIKEWIDKKSRATIPASEERAGKTAAARTFATAGANIEIVMSRAGPVLTNAAEAANAVPASQFKRINELYQKTAEEISDPAIRNFKVANEEVAALFAAVLNPRSGVITVSAMDHARQLIAASDGPEAYQSILENIKRLAERESEQIQRLRSGQGASPINIPPISPNRRASGEELTNKTFGRAGSAQEQLLPGSIGRREPSGVRIGAEPPRPPAPVIEDFERR
jgi:hypothetical protein